jgi:dimethylhistidine N-methyltransferase
MAQETTLAASDDRLILHNLSHDAADFNFAGDVRAGLTAEPKRLYPKYFYDALGSELFDAICLLPEYYLTRAENEILTKYADEIVAAIPGPKTLLEMGSGSASKTRVIIEALLRKQRTLNYIPVDISASALETSSRVLLQSYPEISVEAYASEYYGALAELREKPRKQTLALFLGSNIGNFDIKESQRFLRGLRSVLKEGDGLLLGADLKKDSRQLEAAYDDALGITAAFNLNLLARINRELGADFELRAFRHIAHYNEEKGCIEVFIESLRDQSVTIKGLDIEVQFHEGERIHTENSYKYDLDQLSRLAAETGFRRAHTWLDAAERFSSNLFIATDEVAG